MTKKKALSSSTFHLFNIGSKLVIFLCVILCLSAFFRVHFQFNLRSPSIPFSRASLAFSKKDHFQGPPKIAFLFLARTNLPLDFVWDTFFKTGDSVNFTIYIHSEPGFVFDESTTRSGFFYGRQLNNSIQVVWGESSMIEAERLLFEAALEDPSNKRLVLLSDSCIPLYNFSYVYSYLMSSSKSFVDSFIDVRGGRYSPEMSAVIKKENWRKGSQWITLVRRHAAIIVGDETVFPIFRKFCKRWPSIDLRSNIGRQIPQLLDLLRGSQKRRNCIPDEHYVQTLLAMNGLEDQELERRTLTYTYWNQSTGRAWHPITFDYADATLQLIKEIKDTNHVYYRTEYRTEWCRVNVKSVPCFLFARKFTPAAAARLLAQGLLTDDHHHPATPLLFLHGDGEGGLP